MCVCMYVRIYAVAAAYSLLFGAKFYALRYVRIKRKGKTVNLDSFELRCFI